MPKILTCLKKRDLLHNPQVSGIELSQYGQEYLSHRRLADALDFFEKAQDQEGIRQVQAGSIEDGNPFLLQQTGRLLKEKIQKAVWRKVGEKALTDGRLQQALTAFRAIPDENKIEEIQTLLRS